MSWQDQAFDHQGNVDVVQERLWQVVKVLEFAGVG